jgi:hypothetical protein
MGWCRGFGTERAAARREPAHPHYASGAGDLLASRSRAFRDEARCWSDDDDPPRDERATSPSASRRPASASASASARSPLRAMDAAVDLRELRASLDAHRRVVPDAGGGRGALVCGPSPDVIVTLGARADGPRRTLARVDAPALERTLAKVVGPPPDTRAAGTRAPPTRVHASSPSSSPSGRGRLPPRASPDATVASLARHPANAPLIAPPLRTPTYVTAARRKDTDDARIEA